jgi:hypothetical protein
MTKSTMTTMVSLLQEPMANRERRAENRGAHPRTVSRQCAAAALGIAADALAPEAWLVRLAMRTGRSK